MTTSQTGWGLEGVGHHVVCIIFNNLTDIVGDHAQFNYILCIKGQQYYHDLLCSD